MSGVCLARLFLVALAGGFAWSGAQADEAAAPAGAVSVAAGPLGEALATLKERTKLEVAYATGALDGKRTRGVEGARSPQEALTALLSGTGLVYFMEGPQRAAVYDILRTQGAGGSTELEQITVEGQGAGGVAARTTGPGGPTARTEGFVATRALTATKTNTPLIETPQSISVVTADQIKAQGVQSIGGAFRYSAGVAGEANTAADTRCGGFQIRGFEATGNTFYKDGLRLPGTDAASFLCLDPFGAERIEILKGPASVLFGQNAPGGVVNYVSKRPTDEAFGEISAIAGQFDRYQGEVDIGGPIDGTTLSYRLTAVARDGKNMIDTVKDNRVFIAPAVTWRPTDQTTLTVLAHYQKDEAGWGLQFLPALGTVFSNDGRKIPTDRFVGVKNFDKYDTEQASVGYLFEHEFNENLVVRQNLRYAHLRNEQELAYGAGYADADSGLLNRFAGAGLSLLDTFAVDNHAQVKVDTGPIQHTMLFGLDYRNTSYSDRNEAYTVGPIDVFNPDNGDAGLVRTPADDSFSKVRQKQAGVYVQDQMKLGRLSLVLGGREDWADTDLNGGAESKSISAFTGKAGMIYNFDSGVAPYVSYSESFLPSLNAGPDGLFKPETGVQYEAGVKYQPPGWNAYVTGAAFELTRQNVVRFFGPVPEATGEITSKGLEFEGVATLANGVNIRAAYAYIESEVTNDVGGGVEGNRPTLVPKNRLSLWADYRLQTGALKGVGAGLGVRYVGSTYGDSRNTFKVPAATVFDAVVSYKKDSYELALNGSNIFDKKYVASCFDGGFGCFYAERRRVVAKATYRW